MKFHIVQVSERIEDISRKYNVAKEEIIKLNRHINNIDSVVPGMKIRLPILSDEVSDQMKDSFLDIEKYYPKVDDFKEVEIEKKIETENDGSVEIETNIENEPEKAEVNVNPYPSYQQQFYPGYPAYPQQFVPQNYPVYPCQQFQYPQYQQQQFIPQNYVQQQMYQQQYPRYQENNQRIKQVPQTNLENTDFTIPNLPKFQQIEDSKNFDKPAFCDPVLLEGVNQCLTPTYKTNTKFFQTPLYNPPYPCGKALTDIEQCSFYEGEFDENVKEINIDLRDFVKKHTKIKKKKDSLNLL